MPIEKPKKIGPYEIIEELGRGGMGVVYRAFDPAIGRPLAIKLLHMPHLEPEAMSEMKQRFAREAAAAGRLSHPGIVTLYQFGQDGDSQYLAMELIPGGPLEKLMREGQPWPAEDALRVVNQVAAALDYAHEHGVVHRDIKPANVLVEPNGRVKVTDFGIARIPAETMTRTGSAMGTPAYMAPEQIQGLKVDAKADQFSLAVVAFRLLSGKLPFAAPTEYALIYQIVNGEPGTLSEANPRIPRGADVAMRRALARDPETRYATCAAFAGALEAAVMGPAAAETAEMTRRTVASPITVKTRRSRAGVWVLASCILAAAAIGWAVHVRSGSDGAAPPQLRPAANTEPRANTAPPMAAALNPAVRVNPKDGLTYVHIQPGTFTMGCSEGDRECEKNEKPPHEVTIGQGFWIGQTPVTQQAYMRVEGTNPSDVQGPNLPVESVSWEDAQNYCKSVDMRLPTEAEWEYAARAGTTGSRYGELDRIAWYNGNSGNRLHETMQKEPNAWGLYDMLGDVWEWTGDWFEDKYSRRSETDPAGPPSGKLRTLRGGAWLNNAQVVRVSYRLSLEPVYRLKSLGFRCAGN